MKTDEVVICTGAEVVVALALAGQNVVVVVMTSVVSLPMGQFVTVGGQEVTV